MIPVKFKECREFIESILPKPSDRRHSNTQLLLEYTVESNKEDYLHDYIKYLIEKNVFILLITQEGNSTFYTKTLSDFHLMTIELTVMDSSLQKSYEFKKFGQIPLNESKILFAMNNVLQEFEQSANRHLLIIFDSLTDLILWLDFNIAYKFMRKCVSNLRRFERVSSIFMINKKSHSAEVLAAFETLFDGILVSEGIDECNMKGILKYRYIIQ